MPRHDQPGQGDRSLRANGLTYRDRNGESDLLVDRLEHGTASVIGIAGARGTGKSSLAQCVLERRAKAGAFTQIIPAPTSYEPAEFLVAVSQRICEGVIADVDKTLWRGDSVSARARIARWRFVARLLAAGTMGAALIAIAPTAMNWEEGEFSTAVAGVMSSPVVWGLVVVGMLLWAAVRAWPSLSSDPRSGLKVGLRSLAVEFSERLRYQSTRSFGAHTGMFASGLNVGRSLSDRPLSLPGLTAQLSMFLGQVAEAYGQPVVICLDELDKITETDALDKLLRGIKGVLGQPETHFLLTVSEDALTKFATRHWADRKIVESAFEDILLLDIVSCDAAREIVRLMHDREPPRGEATVAVDLMWVFGGGIPREIKRSTRICLEAHQPPAIPTAKAHEIWKTLFRARLEEITQWTLRAGGEWEFTHNFVRSLEHSATQVEKLAEEMPDMEWARALVGPWVGHMGTLAAAAVRGEAGAVPLGQATVAIIVGGSAVVYTLSEDAAQLGATSRAEPLHRIFELERFDLGHTRELLTSYLKEIGLVPAEGE